MNIVYTTDDKFIPQVATGMASVLSNNEPSQVHFYVVAKQVTDERKDQLTKFVEGYGATVQFVDVQDASSYAGVEIDTGSWNDIVLSRLFLDQLLPDGIDRVLYLDGDTIVRHDLSEVYDMDMTDVTVAGAPEYTVNQARKKDLGLSENQSYINAGILLINLKRWKELETGKRILQYFKDKGGQLFANDQDAINGRLKDEIFYLPPSYNWCNSYVFYPYRTLKKLAEGQSFYEKEEFEEIVGDPVIVHYLGEERPWRDGNHHKYYKEFYKYLAMTPWGSSKREAKKIIEEGWKKYFFCFYTFNFFMKPFPGLRFKIMDKLIPLMIKHRKKS